MTIRNIAGWLLSALVCIVFVFAGFGQAASRPSFVQMWHAFGYPHWFMVFIGGLEIVAAVLLIVPVTARLGATLLSIIMFGAIVTHVTHGQASFAPMPGFFAILAIAGVWLRSSRAGTGQEAVS